VPGFIVAQGGGAVLAMWIMASFESGKGEGLNNESTEKVTEFK
jgi:hypothetical protein